MTNDEMKKRDEDAQCQRVLPDAKSAICKQHCERQHAKKLDHRIKPAVSGYRILEREHVIAIDLFKLFTATLLAIEQLKDRNARYVLL